MTAFCVDTLQVEAGLHPEHGILRADAIAMTSDARVAADRIIERANADADAVRAAADESVKRAISDAEQKAFEDAIVLIATLEKTNELFLQRSQEMVVGLALELFDRLVLETTPRERVEAALLRIRSEAPSNPAGAVLRVHPEDQAYLPAIEWEVKVDSSLAPGVCCLEAGSGEWRADFNASVNSLKTAFRHAVETIQEPDEGHSEDTA